VTICPILAVAERVAATVAAVRGHREWGRVAAVGAAHVSASHPVGQVPSCRHPNDVKALWGQVAARVPSGGRACQASYGQVPVYHHPTTGVAVSARVDAIRRPATVVSAGRVADHRGTKAVLATELHLVAAVGRVVALVLQGRVVVGRVRLADRAP